MQVFIPNIRGRETLNTKATALWLKVGEICRGGRDGEPALGGNTFAYKAAKPLTPRPQHLGSGPAKSAVVVGEASQRLAATHSHIRLHSKLLVPAGMGYARFGRLPLKPRLKRRLTRSAGASNEPQN